MKNQNILRLGQVFILLTFFSGWIFAQKTVVVNPTPKPTPKVKPVPKPKCENCPEGLPDTPTPGTPGVLSPAPIWDKSTKGVKGGKNNIPDERSIEVDSEVNIGFCVSDGNLKINGWDRDEIRVFINQGSNIGFKILNKNEDGNPTRMTILGSDPMKDKGRPINQCLSGDVIEMDVPKGTNLTRLEGREGRVAVTIESISKAKGIIINGGDIRLREIEDGISAKTFEGNITVEGSSGPISLDATNGSILVYNVQPIEDGDALKVKTNSGQIVLQSAIHSVIDASSITGSIRFTGEIQSDGQYIFKNTNGQILLGIPIETSCMIQVISQKNKFSYEVPLKILTQDNNSPTIQRITGQMGEGEANINIENQNGLIRIRKIN